MRFGCATSAAAFHPLDDDAKIYIEQKIYNEIKFACKLVCTDGCIIAATSYEVIGMESASSQLAV